MNLHFHLKQFSELFYLVRSNESWFLFAMNWFFIVLQEVI